MSVVRNQDLRNESEDDSEEDLEQKIADTDSESEDFQISDETEELTAVKRKSETDTMPVKHPKTNTDAAERERKARVDAIWAEMNMTQPAKRSTPTPTNKSDSQTPQPDARPPQPDTKPPQPDTKPPQSDIPQKTTNNVAPKPSKKPSMTRPQSSLSALVSQYNIKVPKMNTLEKSKLDWKSFVDKEGIKDDLKYQNKDGYMEKVAFLQRVDDRRLTHLKSGQQAGKKKQ